jgi:hypothetical protein
MSKKSTTRCLDEKDIAALKADKLKERLNRETVDLGEKLMAAGLYPEDWAGLPEEWPLLPRQCQICWQACSRIEVAERVVEMMQHLSSDLTTAREKANTQKWQMCDHLFAWMRKLPTSTKSTAGRQR